LVRAIKFGTNRQSDANIVIIPDKDIDVFKDLVGAVALLDSQRIYGFQKVIGLYLKYMMR
jgi:hypothetical protein